MLLVFSSELGASGLEVKLKKKAGKFTPYFSHFFIEGSEEESIEI